MPPTLAVRFIFPHARPRPVTINNGYVMRAWYDITGLGPDRKEDDAGIRESAGVVNGYIEQQNARGIATDRIVIAGFSQGGAIALQAALRYPKRLAGVMALSTYLPLRDTVAAEAAPANRDVPILMCHGLRDGMVPATLGKASRDLLVSLGYPGRMAGLSDGAPGLHGRSARHLEVAASTPGAEPLNDRLRSAAVTPPEFKS